MVPDSIIKHYTKIRSLVTIKREELEVHDLHGFVLDFNQEWIMLLREYDLRLDGLLILKRSDVTSMNCSATNAFQQGLMEDEGVLDVADFSYSFEGRNIKEFLEKTSKDTVVIIEDEKEDIFLVGTGVGMRKDSDGQDFVELDYFSGVGKYDDERSEIYLDTVSMFSIHSNYTEFYERYFKRLES